MHDTSYQVKLVTSIYVEPLRSRWLSGQGDGLGNQVVRARIPGSYASQLRSGKEC
ncbi:hypothetical protein AVEN_58975-1, partial [Araneus ventricosus]